MTPTLRGMCLLCRSCQRTEERVMRVPGGFHTARPGAAMFHLLGENSFRKAPLPPRSLQKGAADGQLCETSLQAQWLEMFHPATAEAEISHEIFGLPVDMHDGLVFASILATASPSIGGDTAAILLAGLSANIWKSELQTVTNDTGVARSTLCIATNKKRNERVRQQDVLCLPAGTRATSSGCRFQPEPGWQSETWRRA